MEIFFYKSIYLNKRHQKINYSSLKWEIFPRNPFIWIKFGRIATHKFLKSSNLIENVCFIGNNFLGNL
jgi:hypothetical protein